MKHMLTIGHARKYINVPNVYTVQFVFSLSSVDERDDVSCTDLEDVLTDVFYSYENRKLIFSFVKCSYKDIKVLYSPV